MTIGTHMRLRGKEGRIMGGHYRTLSAVFLILERAENGRREMLLQKRQNTGHMDGMWDCACSGHVEENESMKMALVREAREELGIRIQPENVRFATFAHNYSSSGIYMNAYFTASDYLGEPRVAEPEKCSALRWFSVDSLPTDIIPNRRASILNYIMGAAYDELGWEELHSMFSEGCPVE